jgi:hypothetical protein
MSRMVGMTFGAALAAWRIGCPFLRRDFVGIGCGRGRCAHDEDTLMKLSRA